MREDKTQAESRQSAAKVLNKGVMLNAYPDSIGANLNDIITLLKRPEFKNAFSLFYLLPTFFNSDLDRGFSVIDYNINEELVSKDDLKALAELNIQLKFDIVLNHLSVASPQFKDLLDKGHKSKYIDFFINWNTFWEGAGKLDKEGVVLPNKEHLDKLFMRKSGLPILKVEFPDGSEQPYWNTFYQKTTYKKISVKQLEATVLIRQDKALALCILVNRAIDDKQDLDKIDFGEFSNYRPAILKLLKSQRSYLGQMDVNANSPLVWAFYEEVLAKVKSYGGQILRLDAFAYLHKQVGESNFFNKPGTWEYLTRINAIAKKNELVLLPEIHAEYGLHLHDEVAKEGYAIYDFFLPGLTIHAIEKSTNKALITWAKEIVSKGYQTINMLGCHDGIPLLDLKGKEVAGVYRKGLLTDEEINEMMSLILERGGRVKNLYGADGKKISYYQVNATYFSALGESSQKLLLARAIQMFMPGIPQVWYLDLFAGINNYRAADEAGAGGHKEINRTTLSLEEVEAKLETAIVQKQLELIRLRNTSLAFAGTVEIKDSYEDEINITWTNGEAFAQLIGSLRTHDFWIYYSENGAKKMITV